MCARSILPMLYEKVFFNQKKNRCAREKLIIVIDQLKHTHKKN